jgi:hypothetical protein
MSDVMKCKETSCEDTYDYSPRFNTKTDNNTFGYYILLIVILVIFYLCYSYILSVK